MKTAWINHIKDPEEKTRFEKGLHSAKWLLDRQKEILESMERGLDRQEASPKAYDSPNWDYRQAHANGFRQCLYQIKELLTLDHEDNNERYTTSV